MQDKLPVTNREILYGRCLGKAVRTQILEFLRPVVFLIKIYMDYLRIKVSGLGSNFLDIHSGDIEVI